MKTLNALALLICLAVLAACGGGGGSGNGGGGGESATGGFTLKVAGGTLNDGSGKNGLAVLATLRDSKGNGPGLNGGWKVTITTPGGTTPLTVLYDDDSPASYQIWRWKGLDPAAGIYTATASNGTATLTSSFTINTASTIQRAVLTKSGNTISWPSVVGAGSYYCKVTDGTGSTVTSGYLNAEPSSASYSYLLPTLADGSYLVEVSAYIENMPRLMNDLSSSPSLPTQGNISLSSMNLVVAGGTAGSYNLTAKGGTLYMGKDAAGTGRYGVVIWSSILTSTATPPAGDWTITVTGPGISTPLTFTYPGTNSHYVYWDFATLPAAGNYTVTATSPGYTLSAGFSIPNPAAQLPVATNITVTPTANSYAISWNAAPGAASYNVNLWATIGGVYTEIEGTWVGGNVFTALVPKSSLTKGTLYDVYVTASSLDMTTMKSLPPPIPLQVDMSDNTFAAVSFTGQ